jgi:hypothetical protein
MSVTSCSYETAVGDAVRTGQWSPELRAHAVRCAECSDVARVAEWLGEVATRVLRNQSLPDPTYLWLRAQLERRARETQTVSRPRALALALAGITAGLLAAAAALVVVPAVSEAVGAAGAWLFAALAEAPPVLITLVGTSLVGFPVLLAATYLLVLRPQP